MTESLAKQKKKGAEVLARMRKKYGVTRLLHEEPDTALLVYLVLREGWDFKKAGRAVRVLEEHFVDWNEVRVSYPHELCELLAFLGGRDLDARVQRMLDLLQEVYTAFNRLQLDALVERDFEETQKILARMETLGLANAYVFLQCLKDAQDRRANQIGRTLVMSFDLLRVGVRLGLVRKTGSLNVGRNAFQQLFAPKQYPALQNLFVRHAEKFCTSKNPACGDCFLRASCPFGGS